MSVVRRLRGGDPRAFFRVTVNSISAFELIGLQGQQSHSEHKSRDLYMQFDFANGYEKFKTETINLSRDVLGLWADIKAAWTRSHEFTYYGDAETEQLRRKALTVSCMAKRMLKDELIGTARVSIHTIACGAVDHELSLRDKTGNVTGRVRFSVKMVELLTNVEVTLSQMRIEDWWTESLPAAGSQAALVSLAAYISDTPDKFVPGPLTALRSAHKSHTSKSRSPKSGKAGSAPSSPSQAPSSLVHPDAVCASWTDPEALRLVIPSADVERMDFDLPNAMCVVVDALIRGKRAASCRIPLLRNIVPGRLTPFDFAEPLEAPAPSSPSAGPRPVVFGRLCGEVAVFKGPRYCQLRGSAPDGVINTDGGVVSSFEPRKGFPVPDKFLFRPSVTLLSTLDKPWAPPALGPGPSAASPPTLAAVISSDAAGSPMGSPASSASPSGPSRPAPLVISRSSGSFFSPRTPLSAVSHRLPSVREADEYTNAPNAYDPSVSAPNSASSTPRDHRAFSAFIAHGKGKATSAAALAVSLHLSEPDGKLLPLVMRAHSNSELVSPTLSPRDSPSNASTGPASSSPTASDQGLAHTAPLTLPVSAPPAPSPVSAPRVLPPRPSPSALSETRGLTRTSRAATDSGAPFVSPPSPSSASLPHHAPDSPAPPARPAAQASDAPARPATAESGGPPSGPAASAASATEGSSEAREEVPGAVAPPVFSFATIIHSPKLDMIEPYEAMPRTYIEGEEAEPMPTGWTMYKDAENRVYFRHRPSKRTSWQDPRFLPDGWEQRLDRNARVYFAYRPAQETTWVDPRGMPRGWEMIMIKDVKAPVFLHTRTAICTMVDPRGLPDGFEMRIDPNSRLVYFKNSRQKKTQWNDPRESLTPLKLAWLRDNQRVAWDKRQLDKLKQAVSSAAESACESADGSSARGSPLLSASRKSRVPPRDISEQVRRSLLPSSGSSGSGGSGGSGKRTPVRADGAAPPSPSDEPGLPRSVSDQPSAQAGGGRPSRRHSGPLQGDAPPGSSPKPSPSVAPLSSRILDTLHPVSSKPPASGPSASSVVFALQPPADDVSRQRGGSYGTLSTISSVGGTLTEAEAESLSALQQRQMPPQLAEYYRRLAELREQQVKAHQAKLAECQQLIDSIKVVEQFELAALDDAVRALEAELHQRNASSAERRDRMARLAEEQRPTRDRIKSERRDFEAWRAAELSRLDTYIREAHRRLQEQFGVLAKTDRRRSEIAPVQRSSESAFGSGGPGSRSRENATLDSVLDLDLELSELETGSMAGTLPRPVPLLASQSSESVLSASSAGSAGGPSPAGREAKRSSRGGGALLEMIASSS